MKRRTAVTLVELVVVMAILAILAAIFLPAIHRLRATARETVCKCNVAQLNLALSRFADTSGIPHPIDKNLVGGWAIDVLPFIEQKNLYFALPIGKPPNEVAPEFFRPPSLFRCPAQQALRDESVNEIQSGHYVLEAGGYSPGRRRKTFVIREAPLSLKKPWVVSYEWDGSIDILAGGPHQGSHFYAVAFEHGVRSSRDYDSN